MANNVFTVFFHGTAFDRDTDPDELISQLSRAVLGSEAIIKRTAPPTKATPLPYQLTSSAPSFLICEGPGSNAVKAKDAADGVRHDRPGVFNPLLNEDKSQGQSTTQNPALEATGSKAYWLIGDRKTSAFQDDFMGNTKASSKISGLGFGSGWDDNVYKAVWLLTHLKFSKGQAIDTVNLIGWSRGAVSCIKTANKIFEVFETTLNVNIVAIDPVPGGLNTLTDDITLLPPNVRNFLGFLALDENGSLFEALDHSSLRLMAPRSQHGQHGNPDSLNPTNLKPRVHFLPFPGNHADLVNAGVSCPEVKKVSALISHIAWQFLSAHGTEFQRSFPLTPTFILQAYEQLMHDSDGIAIKARTKWVSTKGRQKERLVVKHRQNYVTDPNDYLNEHHRLVALNTNYSVPPVKDACFQEKDRTNWHSDQMINDWCEWQGGKSLALPLQSPLLDMGIKPCDELT